MSKRQSVIICVLYGCVTVALSLLLLFLPKDRISPRENRYLATKPSFSAEALISGELASDFSAFCADHFPFRDALLRLDSSAELALGRLETGGVMVGRDRCLIKRLEYNDGEILEDNLCSLESLLSVSRKMGKRAVFFCAPRAVDVLVDSCPPFFDAERSDRAWEKVENAESVRDELRKRAEKGEYVFYRTDHHWTSLGAYYAYCALGESLGYTPYGLDDFEPKEVCTDFFGTTYSSVLLGKIPPDSITAYRYEGDERLRAVDGQTQRELPLYDCSALEGSSKYDFFLGGNRAFIRIENEGKPHLTVVKDSYGNSLIPFLARHFSIDAVDPRYLREPLEDAVKGLLDSRDSAGLLVLFGLDTLSTERLYSGVTHTAIAVYGVDTRE